MSGNIVILKLFYPVYSWPWSHLVTTHVVKALEGITCSKEVFEDFSGIMEGVVEMCSPAPSASPHATHSAWETVLPIFVVQISFFLVTQDLVGLGYLLELFLSTSWLVLQNKNTNHLLCQTLSKEIFRLKQMSPCLSISTRWQWHESEIYHVCRISVSLLSWLGPCQ